MSTSHDSNSATENPVRPQKKRRWPLVALVAIVAVTWFAFRDSGPAGPSSIQLAVVERGDFNVILPVLGELAALKQVEVRNKLESRAIITDIVPEGTAVHTGDIILKLAEEELKTKVDDAADKANNAGSALVAAEQSLAIKLGERQSELDKSDLSVRLASLALEGWANGDVVSKRQQLATGIETTRIDKERCDRRFTDSKSLVEKGFISRDDYEKDRIAKIQADAKLAQAELDIKVYEEFQHPQDQAKIQSDLDQAKAERARVEQKHDAELVKTRAEVESAKFQWNSAKERLEQLQTQLTYCAVQAPSDGLVVYASSMESGGWGRGSETPPPAVGTELRPNELVLILPDTSAMMANLKVSEALSGKIKPGQSVVVFSDAHPFDPISGEVATVSVLAETGGRYDPNRRDYKVRVRLSTDPTLGLKPSMRCKGEILLDSVIDAVMVPVQSIFRQGAVSLVYVPEGRGFAQRQVTVGRTSELEAEILSGLEEGEEVLLRSPRVEEIVSRLPSEVATPDDKQARGSRGGSDPAGEANSTTTPQ